jgi:carboxypeptidase Taq
MESKYNDLKNRLLEINDLHSVNAVLGWDQATYMPPGGATARARQMATVGRLAHEKFTDRAIGNLLDDLLPYAESLPYESDEAGLLRLVRREYDQAVRVPASFMSRLVAHGAESYGVWTQARPADDFTMVRPYLERTLDMSRELGAFYPEADHISDPLIEFADYGMDVATLRPLFAALREQLVPIMRAIVEQAPAEDDFLFRSYPEADQMAFGEEVIRRLGYDFERGRQDKTHHPFMTKFSIDDVRITTRYRENSLGDGLFSSIHEAGHAMYEQGIDPAFEGTPLASGTSAGMHESQSRLWENVVGRSRGFWEYFYPGLQERFPGQLGDVSLDRFYRAINKVEPSLIRTDADEVTYNLHVIIRFDLGLALLEGDLEIKDLPEAWRERYHSDLGVAPIDDRDGVLQDVHWYGGMIGGQFQGYTLGNILGAQIYDAALQAHPEIPDQIRQGQFDTLREWLTGNIYRHGSKFTTAELIERITGGPLRIEPYIAYLRAKYGELYDL